MTSNNPSTLLPVQDSDGPAAFQAIFSLRNPDEEFPEISKFTGGRGGGLGRIFFLKNVTYAIKCVLGTEVITINPHTGNSTGKAHNNTL